MAKEKLFKPEDFDKTKDKNLWQKNKKWIIGIATLLIVALIVICCIFCGKEEQKKEEVSEQVSQKPLSLAYTDGTDVVETDTAHEIHKVVNVKSETNNTAGDDDPKNMVKQQVSTPPEAFQPMPVSDNIDQEAMNVIRGNYGNVPERREKLGYKYQEIQNRVNQLKREGAF